MNLDKPRLGAAQIGMQTCESVFGDENNPLHAGYLVVEEDQSGKEGRVLWFERLTYESCRDAEYRQVVT